jgi:hypothetical protein
MEEEGERVETKASIEGATEHGQRKRGYMSGYWKNS